MGAEGLLEALDSIKHGWSALLWLFLVPLTIVLVGPAIKPAQAVHHFTFHRMQHYEHAGVVRGSPAVSLNCEVRNFFSSTLSRKCLVLTWKEFISGDVGALIQRGIVALIIALPADLDVVTAEERAIFVESEQSLLKTELQIPVYFVKETKEVREWLTSLSYHAGQKAPQTATQEIMQQVTGDYYYLSSSLSAAKQITDVKANNFFGKLTSDPSEQLPVILLVAHLDSFGIAPGVSFGASSDATGTAALLETVRLLNELVKSQKSQPKVEVAVLLSGAAKFNFHGTKKWLDEQNENMDLGMLNRIQYAACLDSVGQKFPPNIYVSRPPKDNSAAWKFIENLNLTAQKEYQQSLPQVHKKINLADDELVWEHEQFSIAKVSAFTLSDFSLTRSAERKSILDTRSQVNVRELAKTVRLFVKVLAKEIYGLNGEDGDVFNGTFMSVCEAHMNTWINLLTKQPRALQYLSADHPAVVAVKDFMSRHLVDFKAKHLVNDKGESDITLYGPLDVAVTASRTKQPFFDLLVTLVVGMYGGLMYLLLQYVDVIAILRRAFYPMLAGSIVKVKASKSNKYQ